MNESKNIIQTWNDGWGNNLGFLFSFHWFYLLDFGLNQKDQESIHHGWDSNVWEDVPLQ